jgi:hypothetical protein
MKNNDFAFRDWLVVRRGLSKKASGDAVSRLNRCIRIQQTNGYELVDDYLDALLQNPLIEEIPLSSRTSMFRSVKLFYEFQGK